MSDLINKIKSISDLYFLKDGCNDNLINKAQKDLGLTFPKEYKEYLLHFGAVSFYATEWTGLNVNGYLNVVEATKEARSLYKDFPKDCFVIENLNVDGRLVIGNEQGTIFYFQGKNMIQAYNNLQEYLDSCIARKK